MTTTGMMSKCETCNERPPVGVYSVPGMPYSAAYCEKCIEADAHPYHIMVSLVVLCCGWDHCADYVKDMVNNTLKHLNKDKKQFDLDVEELGRSLDEYEQSTMPGDEFEVFGGEDASNRD